MLKLYFISRCPNSSGHERGHCDVHFTYMFPTLLYVHGSSFFHTHFRSIRHLLHLLLTQLQHRINLRDQVFPTTEKINDTMNHTRESYQVAVALLGEITLRDGASNVDCKSVCHVTHAHLGTELRIITTSPRLRCVCAQSHLQRQTQLAANIAHRRAVVAQRIGKRNGGDRDARGSTTRRCSVPSLYERIRCDQSRLSM